MNRLLFLVQIKTTIRLNRSLALAAAACAAVIAIKIICVLQSPHEYHYYFNDSPFFISEGL